MNVIYMNSQERNKSYLNRLSICHKKMYLYLLKIKAFDMSCVLFIKYYYTIPYNINVIHFVLYCQNL